ncbi:MAG TPA: ABC transporter permease [Burkholderiaceae bacterium]|nr:ABC transporter permease [Burkholderiaceae bacterium]
MTTASASTHTAPLQHPRGIERLQLPLAVVAALVVGFLITATVSREPWRAYLALTTGALPDIRWSDAQGWEVRRWVRFGSVIEDAITLTFLGLAIAIPFRARQFSLGADGQLFLSALAAAAVSLYVGGPWFTVLPVAFTAAVLTGFAWGLIPGVLKARFGANEIVTTLMLNLIAVQFYRLVITQALRDPAAGYLVTPTLPAASLLPGLLPRTNVTAMLFLVPLVVAAAALLLSRTTIGYEIRTVGVAPAFARQVGMPVGRAVVMSMALGGAFAAFAGLHVSNALLKRLPVDLSPGMGFEGLVVALLARNDPKSVPVAAFLYAYLRTGAQAMERTTDVSREVVLVIQAFIILFIVSERLLPTLVPRRFAHGWARQKRGHA